MTLDVALQTNGWIVYVRTNLLALAIGQAAEVTSHA
jgi:hypothetical protein